MCLAFCQGRAILGVGKFVVGVSERKEDESGLEIKNMVRSPWRNLVARCKFLVASLYNQKNLILGLFESV